MERMVEMLSGRKEIDHDQEEKSGDDRRENMGFEDSAESQHDLNDPDRSEKPRQIASIVHPHCIGKIFSPVGVVERSQFIGA